jgi:hypothetical protein
LMVIFFAPPLVGEALAIGIPPRSRIARPCPASTSGSARPCAPECRARSPRGTWFSACACAQHGVTNSLACRSQAGRTKDSGAAWGVRDNHPADVAPVLLRPGAATEFLAPILPFCGPRICDRKILFPRNLFSPSKSRFFSRTLKLNAQGRRCGRESGAPGASGSGCRPGAGARLQTVAQGTRLKSAGKHTT